MKGKIKSFRNLEVYKKLCELHLEICKLTMGFPKFELYELGSQIRRSSNSIPANVAEGWNNKHINIYLECINRALGELQETQHHLYIAHRKIYLSKTEYENFSDRYDECGKMLNGLYNAILHSKKSIT